MKRLHGGFRVHITSKSEAFRIAQEILAQNVVFGYQKQETPRLVPYIQEFWDYEKSPYVKRKKVEGSNITKVYVKNMLQAFEKHCIPHIPENLPIDGFTVSMMDRIKNSLFDSHLSSSTIHRALESVKVPLIEAYK